MANNIRKLRKSIDKNITLKKADRTLNISGILGMNIGGTNTVEVPGREGYVYVRLRDNLSELIQVYNDKVSPVYGLPVLISRDQIDPTKYRIVERDLGRYASWGTSSYIPRHGNQHSFNSESGGGGDIAWIYPKQFTPLLLTPSGSVGAGNVIIEPYTFYTNKSWIYAGNTGTSDLLGYKPTGSWARMVLIYLNQLGNPVELAGDFFDATLTGTAQILPFMPSIPDTTALPLGGIRLVSGTASILWRNIYDLRPMLVGDGFIPTGTAGHAIADEGTPLTDRPILNFTGPGILAIDDPGNNRTNVVVSGTARHIIADDGTPFASRTILDFVGPGVFVQDTGSSTEVVVSGTATDFASLAESQAGTESEKAVAPDTLPVWIRNNAFINSNNYSGNARGTFATDLQASRSADTDVAAGNQSTIGGGSYNSISASCPSSVLSGGYKNAINAGSFVTVGGGYNNNSSGGSSVIGGGEQNTIGVNSSSAVIGGGYKNRVFGNYGTIGGGQVNTVSGTSGVIAGGYNNMVTAPYNGAILGGVYNAAFGNSSSVGGGYNNTASDYASTVVGGAYNTASGYGSIVNGGICGVASLYGESAKASGMFASGGDAQERKIIARVSTTDSTPTEVFLDGSNARLTIPSDTTWTFSVLVAARRTDGDNESAGYEFKGVIDNNAGTTALVGSVSKTVFAEDTSAWDFNITADDTNDSLKLEATGENAKTIYWVATCKIVQVTG